MDGMSELEDAAEDGNLELFLQLLRIKKWTQQELEDAMDTAYRGTKVTPQVVACVSMVKELSTRFNITVPTYSFNTVRHNLDEFKSDK